MDFLSSLLKQIQTLQGIKDQRGPVGILSRGKNVYGAGGSLAAQKGGGPQYGRRPSNTAVQRRLFNR
jgi:hypothetical protein